MGKRILRAIIFAVFSFSCTAERHDSKAPGFMPYHRVDVGISSCEDETLISGSLEFFRDGKQVYGGILSHHGITDAYLNEWFLLLTGIRKVNTFVIIAPDHFNRSVQDVAITTLPWISRDGEVHANLGLADKIMNRLEVTEEHDVFDSEHGIKVIVPYIIKYFPGSKIVPIVQKDHKYIKSKLDLLVSVINEVIQNKEDCVVIISSDFSHYFDLDTTYKKDAVSEYYLKNQWDKELSLPECDNRNGLYILNRLGETNANYRNMHILKYSNSYEITGRNPENVTSYFFTYYYGNKK